MVEGKALCIWSYVLQTVLLVAAAILHICEPLLTRQCTIETVSNKGIIAPRKPANDS